MSEDRKKDKHAVALGRRGGLKGGAVRASRLSSERKVEIAFIASVFARIDKGEHVAKEDRRKARKFQEKNMKAPRRKVPL